MLTVSVLSVAAALTGVGRASGAPGELVRIDSTMPRWVAQSSLSRSAATAASTSRRLDVRVYLAPRGGQAALEAKVSSLSDPSSADYGKWLSVAQYRAAYGPTKAAASTIQDYLASYGVKVTGVEAQRRYVSASGTVSQLQKAFHTSLRNYTHAGQQVVAPDAAAQLPSSVASSVLTVTGLDTTVVTMTHRHTTAVPNVPDGFVNGKPCSLYFGQVAATYQADFATPLPQFDGRTLSYAPCGYTGPQLRSVYEGDTKLTGAGATIAITDAYAWSRIASDANRYAVNHGDGSYAAGQLVQSLPNEGFRRQKACGGADGWSGEEVLDVESAHAMAPDADIRYYASRSCFDDDFLETLGRVVDDNQAQIVTNSWGDVEEAATSDLVIAYRQILLQGAAQGISFLWSSGDDGDELANGGIKQADFPASLPEVTAVGGTALGIGAGGTRVFETGWGTQTYALSADGGSWTPGGFLYGAGGGESKLFNKPSYQQGVVPSSYTGRAVPDVSMDADPNTGMLIGQTQKFSDGVRYGEYRIGGTSLASPLLAGMTALAVQQRGGKGYGLLNPAIYAASATVATDVRKPPARYPGVVRVDYVNGENSDGGLKYSVRTFGQDSSLPVTKGWDPVTGVGVPNAGYFGLTAVTSPVASPARAAARR